MEIIHKLFKMNREQIQKICDKMECKHGSKSDMIHDLLKPLNPGNPGNVGNVGNPGNPGNVGNVDESKYSTFRKGYINNLKQESKYLQNLLKNKEKNLKKIKSEKKSKWFVDKANKEIEELQMKIMKIQDEINNISEDKLLKMFAEENKQLGIKKIKGKEKFMKKIAGKKHKDKAYSEDLKKTRAERKEDKNFNRQLKQAYRHYQRIQLPPYLQQKLLTMPGNRGFVYKSIHYYGHLPDNPHESVILTERKPDGTFLTHEYTDTEYIIHSKKGAKRQKIIHREKLKVPIQERKKKKTIL